MMGSLRAQFMQGYQRWEDRLTGVKGAGVLVAASGISPRLWRLYAQAWLVCLLFPILDLVQRPLPLPPRIFALLGLAIFVLAYTGVMWSHPLGSGVRDQGASRQTIGLVIGLIILTLALSLVYGATFLWLYVGLSAIVGVMLPARSAFLTVMALTLLTLGMSVSLAGGVGAADWLHIVPLVLLVRGLGLDMAGITRLVSALRELHAARGELARMAVIEERLRVARDLHDLLGHTLSVITLKSELAGRLIDHDPARAAREIDEVERVARQTLREVRATIGAYRQPTLCGELEDVRQLLEAAGVAYTVDTTTETLPPAIDAALGWTVREGVTNVIRHSRPRWCRIQVTVVEETVVVTISNDGVQTHAPATRDQGAGSGLAGLQARITSQGGQITFGSLTGDTQQLFRLSVALPLHSGLTERRTT